MLSSPIQDETLVDNYRKTPTAEWRNGKGQKKHITELYAIHPDATQERNIFRGDELLCRQVLSLMIQIRLSRSATC